MTDQTSPDESLKTPTQSEVPAKAHVKIVDGRVVMMFSLHTNIFVMDKEEALAFARFVRQCYEAQDKAQTPPS